LATNFFTQIEVSTTCLLIENHVSVGVSGSLLAKKTLL